MRTVNTDDLAGDVAAGGHGQERDGAGLLCWLGGAAQGRPLCHLWGGGACHPRSTPAATRKVFRIVLKWA